MIRRDLVSLAVQDRSFDFTIFSKSVILGPVRLRQAWMAKSNLYGAREKPQASVLAECFWALCQDAQARGEPEHPDDSQTYLLARLEPFMLDKHAARVMPDRALGRTDRSQRLQRDGAARLEQVLADAQPRFPTVVEFSRETYDYLGMPEMTPAAGRLYQEIVPTILDDPAALMADDREAAVQLAITRWETVKRRLYPGRRWKSAEAKLVLSVLSYECRTAVHEAYSDVWKELLRPGSARGGFRADPAELVFLNLWHLLHTAPAADRPDQRFDLFHGHVFALHPSLSLLISAPTGRRIVGEFLAVASGLQQVPEPGGLLCDCRDLMAFKRLLGAVQLAVLEYVGQRQDLSEVRSAERAASEEQLQWYAERTSERKLGRSRGGGMRR